MANAAGGCGTDSAKVRRIVVAPVASSDDFLRRPDYASRRHDPGRACVRLSSRARGGNRHRVLAAPAAPPSAPTSPPSAAGTGDAAPPPRRKAQGGWFSLLVLCHPSTALAHFAYVNPRRTRGGTLYLRNPGRRELDSSTTHDQGFAPSVSTSSCSSRSRCSPQTSPTLYGRWPKRCASRPTSRRHVRPAPKAASTGDVVDGGRRQVHSDSCRQAGGAGYLPAARVEKPSSSCGTIRSTCASAQRDELHPGFAARLSPKPVARRRRQAESLGQIAPSTRSRSGPTRSTRGPWGRRRPEPKPNPDYSAATAGAAGLFQFRSHRLPPYNDNDVGREASSARDFDFYREYRRSRLGRQQQARMGKWAILKTVPDRFVHTFSRSNHLAAAEFRTGASRAMTLL